MLSMVGLDPTTQTSTFALPGKVWVVGSSPTMERQGSDLTNELCPDNVIPQLNQLRNFRAIFP